MGVWHPLAVLILGLLYPLACMYLKIEVPGEYWMYVSVVLWVRLWHGTFSGLDVNYLTI